MYSVPPEYIGQTLQLQAYDNQVHLYYNTELVTVHLISNKKMNYHKSYYESIISQTLAYDSDKIKKIAEENLKNIGERYNNDRTRAAY